MSSRTKWIVLCAGIIIIGIVIAIVHHYRSNSISQGNSQQNDSPTSTAAIGVALSSTGENSVAVTPSKASSSSSPVPVTQETYITIHLLTPIANNNWTIGQPNPIAWDTAAGITGEIDLVDATTKQFIGVIDSDVGVLQTSYIWDARTVALARYSPDSKNVVPGVYSIRIHFDGNNLGDLVSGPITIGD